MNSHYLRRAYLIGRKLAELNNANELAEALSKVDEPTRTSEVGRGVKDSKSTLTGDAQYKGGDTWGHKVELFMPSNMGVPSR
jgi:hypothetical protein